MKLKLTESEVSQEIDLEKVLGSVSDVPAVTEAFSQALIDHIKERTESGRDINGKLFAPYSKAYKESLAFSVFGKSNPPNMTLTGDMLGTMFTEESNGKLNIKLDGDTNNAKAYGHITGFKGHPTLDGKVKPREFFGVTEKELSKIAKEFKPDLSREAQRNDNIILSKLLKLFGS
jgi:hypothetical protein